MVTKFSTCSMSIFYIALLCIALGGPVAYADDPPTQWHQALYPTTYAPLERSHIVGGQPIVQVTLNKTQSAAFMVDTGASFSVLSPEMAKSLNLKPQSATLDDGTPYLWQGKQASKVAVSVVKIGNFSITIDHGFFRILPDRNFMLFPNPNSDDTPFDGVLGVNVLEHFAVLLDASQHVFGLCVPGNLTLQQVGQAGYTAPYVLPITQKDGFWFVTVQLTNNGISQSEDLVLDTGSNVTRISDTAAAHLGLKITEEQRITNIYSNSVPVGASSVDALQIGGIVLSGHAIKVAPVSKLEPPLLGMDILSSYRVLIDFPAKKMYLQSNTAAIPKITVEPQATPPAQTPVPQTRP